MYSLNMPVAKIRAKIRQEFEKHRYVNNLLATDVLITQSHMEFQVRPARSLNAQLRVAVRLTVWLGNTEFLEAENTCDEILQK